MRSFIFISVLLISSFLTAQVGIGTETPNEKSVLDIISPQNDKGILIPRLTEAQRDLINPADTENGLIIYNIEENCLNYWEISDSEWKSICGSMSKAQFSFDCSSIEVNGDYVEGKDTNSSNYISLKVNVTKAGIWNITIISDISNGYSFVGQGVFTETGEQIIRIQAQGKPVVKQTDTFTVSSPGTINNCSVQVEVKTNTATYSINCSSIITNGQYVKGTPLVSTNTITLNVNVSVLGSYTISTPVTNGISFTASGVFTGLGTQPITLTGKGVPTVNLDFPVTINTNSEQGNNICSVTIPMTLPAMTYAIIGNNVWSWAAAPRITALTNGGTSFGPNGIVKMVNFTQLWQTSTVSTATGYLTNGFSGKQPDVVLYFAYGASPNAALTEALKNYINKGGCVIYGSSDNTSADVNILMSGLFGITPAIAQSGGAADDDVYPVNNLLNDPVISGPFGNLSGRHWGEDNATTGSVIMTELPANSIQVATARSASKTGTNPEYSIIWYNDSKNFLYFGDSTGASTTDNSSGSYPARYSSQGLPQSKLYGPSGYTQYTYNAALELNAVAWALKKAASSGINPH